MSNPSTPEELELVKSMMNSMLDALAKDENRFKAHWSGIPIAHLHNRLTRNFIALERCPTSDKETFRRKCVNIANYAAMLAERVAPEET